MVAVSEMRLPFQGREYGLAASRALSPAAGLDGGTFRLGIPAGSTLMIEDFFKIYSMTVQNVADHSDVKGHDSEEE